MKVIVSPKLNRIVKVKQTAPSSGGSGAWGAITGTLADQTDLVSALAGKADALTADENYVTDAEKVVIANTSGTNSGDQDLSGKENLLTTATSDSTPVDTDEVITLRSGTKRSTWTVIKAFFKTYFDTLYLSIFASVIEAPGSAETVLTTWCGKRIRFTSAGAVTLTIPATTGFTAGFQCSLFNDSANAIDVTFSGTIVASGTKIAQKKGATLRMDDVFRATGGLS